MTLFKGRVPFPKRPRVLESFGAPIRRVTNRVFLLGLDSLYREAMKRHEQAELLRWAEAVASKLGVGPADVPVEGYYTETASLTRYFRLVRGLQQARASLRDLVADSVGFRELEAVLSSRIFGFTVANDPVLLPRMVDAMAEALRSVAEWTIPRIVAAAQRASVEHDDYSLVGLAARAADPLVLASVRESAVLYAAVTIGAAAARPPEYHYVWDVDPDLARHAARFVTEFNVLLSEHLPEPRTDSAPIYWMASDKNKIRGRCVAIGRDPASGQFYHWAVRMDGDLEIEEFWKPELWTTERYRAVRVGGWKLFPRMISP